MEIINVVQDSELGVKRTLEELGIGRSTFYEWYKRYLSEGYDGLKPKEAKRRTFWNKIPDKERSRVVERLWNVQIYHLGNWLSILQTNKSGLSVNLVFTGF